MRKVLFILFLMSLSFAGCTENKSDTNKSKDDVSKNMPKPTEIPFEVQRDLSVKMIEAIDVTDFKAIDKLIEEGADIDFQESIGGFSLLMHALMYKHFDSAKYLIEKGAMADLFTFKGISPLMMAIQVLNLDLVKFLISKGADISAKDVDGRPPLYYAIYQTVLKRSLNT